MKAAALELLFGVLLVAVIFGLGFTAQAKLDAAKRRAATAEANVRRLQGELAQANLSERVVTRYVDRVQVVREAAATITKEIPVYVTVEADAACPIPVGFVRVHNAAAEGVPLGEPAGDSNAPAAGLTLSAVAATVNDNYAACHENAEQVTALQAYLRGLQAIETP